MENFVMTVNAWLNHHTKKIFRFVRYGFKSNALRYGDYECMGCAAKVDVESSFCTNCIAQQLYNKNRIEMAFANVHYKTLPKKLTMPQDIYNNGPFGEIRIDPNWERQVRENGMGSVAPVRTEASSMHSQMQSEMERQAQAMTELSHQQFAPNSMESFTRAVNQENLSRFQNFRDISDEIIRMTEDRIQKRPKQVEEKTVDEKAAEIPRHRRIKL